MGTNMIKKMACCICVSLIIFTQLPTVHAAVAITLTVPSALMRAQPSHMGKVIKIVHAHDKFMIIMEKDNYYWVEHGGTVGFIPKSAFNQKDSLNSRLVYGDSGLMVTWLQNTLRQQGFYKGEPTGFYGIGTRNAVLTFQRANNLIADGNAGISTEEALIAKTQSRTNVTAVNYTAYEPSEQKASTYKYLLLGSHGDNVLDLQQALYDAGFLRAMPTGYFGEDTEAAVVAFQRSMGIWDDGVAGEDTQDALFSAQSISTAVDILPRMAGALKPEAKSSKQENGVWVLHWDDGDVERIFPRYTYATVIDARTGMRYQIRRFQGTNHADVELVTHDDYYTFLETIGGDWTWNARPIYLELDGELYAAAINGMPHGDVTLTDNGVDGHFCIHFKGSTTHASGHENASMQDAIKEAVKLAEP